MRYTILALFIITMAFTTTKLYNHNHDLCSGIIAENDMWIGVNDKSASKAMTEEIFNRVIDDVENVYAPIIDDMGYRLNIIRKWDDGTVNAYARRIGNTMEVNMFGGLARHQSITPDGFAMVVCHETGHHLGGAPKKAGWFGSWASNEGQADYWAATKCMKKVYENDDNIALMADVEMPQAVIDACNSTYTDPNEIALCQRIAMAGHSLGDFFRVARELEVPVRFDTPDPNIVRRTFDDHPEPQCRLDTYFQGGLCTVSHDVDVDDNDASIGVCARSADYEVGVRPLCWYKP